MISKKSSDQTVLPQYFLQVCLNVVQQALNMLQYGFSSAMQSWMVIMHTGQSSALLIVFIKTMVPAPSSLSVALHKCPLALRQLFWLFFSHLYDILSGAPGHSWFMVKWCFFSTSGLWPQQCSLERSVVWNFFCDQCHQYILQQIRLWRWHSSSQSLVSVTRDQSARVSAPGQCAHCNQPLQRLLLYCL